MDQGPELRELIGVYHADGGPIGEARYVLGRMLGTAHCGLCDITHSPVRRKPEWDRIGIEHLARLPAIQWKLINIRKMGSAKQKAALDKLVKVLST